MSKSKSSGIRRRHPGMALPALLLLLALAVAVGCQDPQESDCEAGCDKAQTCGGSIAGDGELCKGLCREHKYPVDPTYAEFQHCVATADGCAWPQCSYLDGCYVYCTANAGCATPAYPSVAACESDCEARAINKIVNCPSVDSCEALAACISG